MSKHKYGNATRQEASLAQAIFWKPDLNDGVRMSIRPFAAADVPHEGQSQVEEGLQQEPRPDNRVFAWFWRGNTFTGARQIERI
jgi:hypothetical protein